MFIQFLQTKNSTNNETPEIHIPIETTSTPINEYEHEPDLISTQHLDSSPQKNKDEYEQTKSMSLVNKSKITFTNYGLWLNQFALQLLNNPTHLSYSFDVKNANLYIASYDKENLPPFYILNQMLQKLH